MTGEVSTTETSGTEVSTGTTPVEDVEPGTVVRNEHGTLMVAPETLEEGTVVNSEGETVEVEPEDVPIRSEHIRRPQDPSDPQDIRFIPTQEQIDEEIARAAAAGEDVDEDGDTVATPAAADSTDTTDEEDDLAQFRNV